MEFSGRKVEILPKSIKNHEIRTQTMAVCAYSWTKQLFRGLWISAIASCRVVTFENFCNLPKKYDFSKKTVWGGFVVYILDLGSERVIVMWCLVNQACWIRICRNSIVYLWNDGDNFRFLNTAGAISDSLDHWLLRPGGPSTEAGTTLASGSSLCCIHVIFSSIMLTIITQKIISAILPIISGKFP